MSKQSKSFLEGHLEFTYNKPSKRHKKRDEERLEYLKNNTRTKCIDIFKATACDFQQERITEDFRAAVSRNTDQIKIVSVQEAFDRAFKWRNLGGEPIPPAWPEIGWVFGEFSLSNIRQNEARRTILYNLYKNNITPAFLDKPLLKPNPDKPWMNDLNNWYTAGYFGTECDQLFYHPKKENCTSERWDKISKELDISIKPYITPGESIVVIAQPRGSMRVNIDPGEWLIDTLSQLAKTTDRNIIVMCTPEADKSYNFALQEAISKLKNVSYYIGEEDDILRSIRVCAHSVVTYNSRLAVTTVLDGINTIATDKSSFVYELGNNTLAHIESPVHGDREQWIYKLSYSQWSSREIRDTKSFWYYYRKLYYGDVGFRL